jgi:CBS domain-containing protein
MAAEECTNERVARDGAPGLRVRDAMIASPKTLPAAATVGELRTAFANPHVDTALLIDGPRLVGVVHREALRDDVPDGRPARDLADREPATIGPDAPLQEALTRLDAAGVRRLAVVDADGTTLRGLLCLTVGRDGFCQS